MKEIVIIAAGGHVREVADILRDQQTHAPNLVLPGFIDDDDALQGRQIEGLTVLGDHPKIVVDRISGLPLGTMRKAVTAINEIYLSEDEGATFPATGFRNRKLMPPQSAAACDVSNPAQSRGQI